MKRIKVLMLVPNLFVANGVASFVMNYLRNLDHDEVQVDIAIWLSILKEGKKAYGVDEPLLIYRIAKSSKSGNKVKAARMNWNTYRYVGLNLMEAIYYECWYIFNGIRKYRNLRNN